MAVATAAERIVADAGSMERHAAAIDADKCALEIFGMGTNETVTLPEKLLNCTEPPPRKEGSIKKRILLKFGTRLPLDESELNNFMLIERKNLPVVTASFFAEAMTEVPDVRAEKVLRGRALIADPNYPSKDQIKSIAGVLATRWKSDSMSSFREESSLESAGPKRFSRLTVNVTPGRFARR